MSIRDELCKRVGVANASAPAIQSTFEAIVKSMEEAADESRISCMLIPLGPMVNAEQRKAVIRKLRAEDIEVIEHESAGPMERGWTELKW